MKLQNTFVQSKMNKDIDERLLPKGQYPHAENIRIANSDGSDVGALENVKGNEKLTNLGLVNATTIGGISDDSNEKLYWFITSDNKDLVVEYDVSNLQMSILLESSKPNGILNFNKNFLITGASKIINGDSKRDLLVWTDDRNPIRVINIERAKTYGVDGFIEKDISLIKNPPRYAPSVVLTYTPTTLENNIENKFLSFAYRYKYLDGGYSALSSFTNYAFSPSKFELDYQTMENEGMKNNFNAVKIEFDTGDKRVTDVELVYKESNSNTLYLIESFNKEDKLWDDSDTKPFLFSSNKSLVALPEDELFRTYDNVPRLAKALEVVGSRLIFANYVEQYDLEDSSGKSINIDYTLSLINKSIAGIPISITTSISDTGEFYFDLSEQDLNINSKITIDINIENSVHSASFEGTFDFIMDKDYASVAELLVSTPFEYFVQTVMTEAFKSNYTIDTPPEDSVIESIEGFVASSTISANFIKIRAPLITYRVDDTPDNTSDNPTNTSLEEVGFFYEPETSLTFKEIAVDSSLKTNRSYEVGLIYLDKNSRATTVLTSEANTIYVAQEFSTTQNKIVASINHSAPSWADRYKLVVKQNRSNYQTIYTNLFYEEGLFRWVKLEGANVNKVSEGDTLIVKSDLGGIIEDVIKVRVLEIASKNKDFIEGNEDSDGNELIEEAGLYMKIKPTGFDMNFDNSTARSYEGSSHLRYPTRTYTSPILGVYDSNEVFVPYKLNAGSRVKIYINFKGRGNISYEANYDQSFRVNSSYDSIKDWFEAEVVDLGSFGEDFTRGTAGGYKDPESGGEYDYGYGFSKSGQDGFTQDGENFYAWAHRDGTASRAVSCNIKIDVLSSEGIVIFETEPEENNSELYYETEQTFDVVDGLHQANIQNQTNTTPTATVELDFFNCYVQGNGAESYRYKDAFNVGTDGFGKQLLANYLNIDLRPTTTSIEGYREVRRFADITYSEPYNENSNLNGLGVFNLSRANYKEDLDKKYGFIQKLYTRDTDLVVFQEDKISKVLYGKDLLMNADGSSNVSSVESVLGQQTAYSGEYGISRNPESFTYDAFNLYFTDAKRGCVCRLGRNGITEISMAGMRGYFKDNFEGSIDTKKVGAYDPYLDQFVLHTSSLTINQAISMDCSDTITRSKINGELVITMDFGLALGGSGFDYNVTEGSVDIEVVWNETVVESLTSESGSGTVLFNKTLLSPSTATIRINSTDCASFNVVGDCPVVSEITVISMVLGNTSLEGLTRNSRYRWISGNTLSSIKNYFTTFDETVVDSFEQLSGQEGINSIPLTGSTVIIDSYKSVNETGSFLDGDRLGYLVSNTEYSENSYQTILDNTTFLTTQEATTVSGEVINNASFTFDRPNNEQYLYLVWDYTNKNQVPLAINDTASVDSGETVIISVLVNDSDPDGDTLTPVIVTTPEYGTVVLNNDGTISYTHDDSVEVSDSFTYYVTDGTDLSNTATVIIDIVQNEAPVANNDTASVFVGEAVIIAVLNNDTDADGDTLTPSIVSNPQYGTVVVNNDGTISYTHDGSSEALDSFTYYVSDGTLNSNTATVNIGIGISAGESISASGNTGVYLVPFIIGTEAGELIAHFNAQNVPDRFQILFDTSGVSNDLADMEVVADSLFVGDNVATSSNTPPIGTQSNLDLFTYNGSSFDTTETGTQSFYITDSVVASSEDYRTDAIPNGDSQNNSGSAQIGAQNKVYMSSSDTVGVEGLRHSDGNIALTFNKSASTSYRAYLRVYGTQSTGWDLFQTEFIT
jgi:hypothetical protein